MNARMPVCITHTSGHALKCVGRQPCKLPTPTQVLNNVLLSATEGKGNSGIKVKENIDRSGRNKDVWLEGVAGAKAKRLQVLHVPRSG